MELNEMKKVWKSIDDISKENRLLKETLILQIIEKKASSSTNNVLAWDILGFMVFIGVLCFCVFSYHNKGGNFLTWDIGIIFAAIVCAIGAIWYIFKVSVLLKIDFSKKIGENIYNINRYNILLKREKISINFIIGPIIVVLMILVFIEVEAPIYKWIVLIAMIVLAAVSTYWSYKRLYQKNIEEILRSLNEIKELKES